MNIMKTYSEQRRDRLDDVVGDYISDENVSAAEFYMDLKKCIAEWLQYHQTYAKKLQDLEKMINGKGYVSIDECPPGTVWCNGECLDL